MHNDLQIYNNKMLYDIASMYINSQPIISIEQISSGIINITYKVNFTKSGKSGAFILQQINQSAFSSPLSLIENHLKIQSYFKSKRRIIANKIEDLNLEIPELIQTITKKYYFIDSNNIFWRAFKYIPSASSFSHVRTKSQAFQIGRGLGLFHYIFKDFPNESLDSIIPELHNISIYLNKYDRVLSINKYPFLVNDKLKYLLDWCLNFIDSFRLKIQAYQEPLINSKLIYRTIHGDPKQSNIMYSNHSKKVIAIVDTDTVQRGLLHNDIGDCVRSSCNIRGEDTMNFEDVTLEFELCEQLLRSYKYHTHGFLTRKEWDSFPQSILLIPFELGLRFIIDYLEGNIYFKVTSQEHNLFRAIVQFKLAKYIYKNFSRLSNLVKEL